MQVKVAYTHEGGHTVQCTRCNAYPLSCKLENTADLPLIGLLVSVLVAVLTPVSCANMTPDPAFQLFSLEHDGYFCAESCNKEFVEQYAVLSAVCLIIRYAPGEGCLIVDIDSGMDFLLRTAVNQAGAWRPATEGEVKAPSA